MKKGYSQPILLVQSFKLNDTIYTASGQECHSWWCRPNGMPSLECMVNACLFNCYSCGDTTGDGFGVDYTPGEAN